MPVRPANMAKRRTDHKLSPTAHAGLRQLRSISRGSYGRAPKLLAYISDNITHRELPVHAEASLIPKGLRNCSNKSNGLQAYPDGIDAPGRARITLIVQRF